MGSSNGRAGSSARILVTDDQEDILRLVERILGDRYECEFAQSAVEAREKLAERAFDLAICDIEMPDESGLELGAQVASSHPDTAVMFISGIDDPDVAHRAAELGAHGYLVKPFGRGQLLITSENALRRRELELAHRAHQRSLELRLQSIIDRAPMPVYAKDREGRYMIANQSACELAGLEPGGLVGLTDRDIMSERSAELARETDRVVLDEGTVYEQQETMIVGGDERVFMTIKFPLYDNEGRITDVCGISPDITAQQQASKLKDQLAETQSRAIEELRSSRLETVERLARAIELHDPGTGQHVNRMAVVAAFLARKVGLEPDHVELLRASAPMHDVGKIGIPEGILSKPGALTPEERLEMQKHTQIGHELLGASESALLRMAAEIALTHHERYDGTGYPRGLAAEEIPLEGRLVAVADVLDALLSDRSYRPAMSVAEAVKLIEDGRGTQFDPEIVDQLLGNLGEALALRK